LKDGQFLADPDKTVFAASKAFQTKLKIPVPLAKRQLVDDLNSIFGKLPRLYWFGLTDKERDQESKGTLKSAKTGPLHHFNGTWEDFRKLEPAWRMENPQRFIDAQLLERFLPAAQAPGMIWGAAHFPDDSDGPSPLNARNGTLLLKVADPIDWDDDPAHFAIQVDDTTGPGISAA